jgi:hypothetical protein
MCEPCGNANTHLNLYLTALSLSRHFVIFKFSCGFPPPPETGFLCIALAVLELTL